MKVECAAILAGGQSSRMGRDKALLPWQGQPLVAHIAAILEPLFPRLCIVTAKAEVARAASLLAVPDECPPAGRCFCIHLEQRED